MSGVNSDEPSEPPALSDVTFVDQEEESETTLDPVLEDLISFPSPNPPDPQESNPFADPLPTARALIFSEGRGPQVTCDSSEMYLRNVSSEGSKHAEHPVDPADPVEETGDTRPTQQAIAVWKAHSKTIILIIAGIVAAISLFGLVASLVESDGEFTFPLSLHQFTSGEIDAVIDKKCIPISNEEITDGWTKKGVNIAHMQASMATMLAHKPAIGLIPLHFGGKYHYCAFGVHWSFTKSPIIILNPGVPTGSGAQRGSEKSVFCDSVKTGIERPAALVVEGQGWNETSVASYAFNGKQASLVQQLTEHLRGEYSCD